MHTIMSMSMCVCVCVFFKKNIHATSSEHCIVAYALSLSHRLSVSQQRHSVLCQKEANDVDVGMGW